MRQFKPLFDSLEARIAAAGASPAAMQAPPPCAVCVSLGPVTPTPMPINPQPLPGTPYIWAPVDPA